jgi:hypothetical protein
MDEKCWFTAGNYITDVYKQSNELMDTLELMDIDIDTIENQYIALIESSSNKNIIQQTRCDQMIEIQKEGLELFINKNADYGDAFAEYGATGVIMRMEDKLKRFISITKSGVNLVDTESLRDTLIDLHNYSAMAIMLLDDNNCSALS